MLNMHNSRLQTRAKLKAELEEAKRNGNKEEVERLQKDIERLEDIIKAY